MHSTLSFLCSTRIQALIIITLISFGVKAQVNWVSSLHQHSSFIPNSGQFDARANGTQVRFAIDHGSTLVMLTDNGITYRFDEKAKNHYRKRGEKSVPRMVISSEFVDMEWSGCNKNIVIQGVEKSGDRHIYSSLDGDKRTVNNTPLEGFTKVVYRGLYDNIDLEYTIHPEQGFKYALILHPGADINKVQMTFKGNHRPELDEAGNLRIATAYGDIIDHAPVSFYKENVNEQVATRFTIDGNSVGFHIGSYDNSRTLVVDPWVQTPSFQNSNKIWNIKTDLNSNVYVYGGDSPMRLRKYDALGNLQWTYNTPWDSANYWVGTMTTDTVGNSYITSGTSSRVRKIDSNGNMVWESPMVGLPGPELEFWSLTFNCDQTQMICGGMRAQSGFNIGSYRGAIMDLSLVDGSILGFQEVGWVNLPRIKEVRSVCTSPNGKYYYLTLDSIGSITDDLQVQYQVNNSYDFSYGIPNYGVTNQGVNLIAANTDFIYTQNGSELHKRYIVDGSIITSVIIPNGSTSTALGQQSPNNGGVALDSCGNVYVGSIGGVHKYDADLNLLASAVTPGAVYDVNVNRNGEVVACGQGFLASVQMQSCHPPLQICLECLQVSNAGPFCASDSPVTLTANPSEGTWSGVGITDSLAGTFSPSLAGTGSHIVRFAPNTPFSCGSDSITIVVSECGLPQVCIDSLGNIAVYGGTFPYEWQYRDTILDCSNCPFGTCIPIFCPGVQATVWSTYASGLVAAPHGTWPIRVIDGAGNEVVINSIDDVTPCEQACQLDVNVINVVQVCVGETNGAATALAVGNLGNVTYLWDTQPAQNTAIATGLGPDTYIVTATDPFGCTDSDTVTISEFPEVIAVASTDTVICLGDSITLFVSGGDTYLWNTGDSLPQFMVAPVETTQFTVIATGAGNCTDSTGVLVIVDERICLGNLPNVFNPVTGFEGLEDFCGMVHQNNTFQLPCLELYPGNRMRIFDRWGRERYDETNYHLNPWDGDGASDGVYFFVLELPNNIKPLKGYFHMLK